MGIINNNHRPPKIAEFLLKKVFYEEFHRQVGDFEEMFNHILKKHGIAAGWLWYWFQVITSLIPFIKHKIYWIIIMLFNYVKIALRNIKKQKMYSFINISGLATGMACCIFIVLYIYDELSFDKFHVNSKKIHRIIIDELVEGKWEHHVGTPDLLGPALVREYPEMVSHVRLFNPNWIDKWTVSFGGKYYYEDNLFFTDPQIFEVFSFPLITGNPETALKEPNSMVITQAAALRYFGDDNPVGKILIINDKVEVKITGVARNVPSNTHFNFDFLVSFESVPFKWALNTWRTRQFYTYILLESEISRLELENKLSGFLEKYFGRQSKIKIHFQPLEEIHLYSKNFGNDMAKNSSDISFIYIFSAAAILLLLIACMNFMNLATARSAARSKEVGMRKVIGARRIQLFYQFLGESYFLSITALLLAVFLVMIFTPAFNTLTGKNLTIFSKYGIVLAVVLLPLTFIIAFLSGCYPAVFLSSFKPVKVLRKEFIEGSRSIVFRRILVVSQFIISVFLITGTIIIYNQVNFCINRDLGFDKEHVLVIPLRDTNSQVKYTSFKEQLLRNPDILKAAGSSSLPGRSVGSRGMFPEGNTWYPRNSIFVDYDFIPTMGIEIIEGRNFSRDFPADVDDAYIVNHAAVVDFNWDSPVGKKIIWAGDRNKKGFVIGVVKDFHYKSFHSKIEPLILHMTSVSASYLSIRMRSENIRNIVSFIENEWENFNPGFPFDYFFLDSNFDKLYRSELKMGEIFNYFTVLAMMISCMGLFGLSAYTVESRTREIGIRKVLGASTVGLQILLSKEFVKLVLISNLIAWPAVYYFIMKWLENFAYRVDIKMFPFILASGIAFIIALFTVSFHTVKAAVANPVDSIMYE